MLAFRSFYRHSQKFRCPIYLRLTTIDGFCLHPLLHYSSESRDRSPNSDGTRFKWPKDGYMPSSASYHMFPTISTSEDAKGVISHMDELSKKLLLQELQDCSQGKGATEEVSVSGSQLYQVFVFNSLPFIGFGILDNGIMIVAGEYIDVTIGAVLGISTMAAAALGNLVSDVAGVGCAGYIELLVCKLGVESPDISLAQSQLKSVRWTVGIGRALGISLGCLLGMIPLLFYHNEKKTENVKEEKN